MFFLHSQCHISQSSHSSGKYRRHTEPSLPFSSSVFSTNYQILPIFPGNIPLTHPVFPCNYFPLRGISHLDFCNSLSTSHLVPKTGSEEQPVCLCIVTMFLLFIKHCHYVPSGLEKVPTCNMAYGLQSPLNSLTCLLS